MPPKQWKIPSIIKSLADFGKYFPLTVAKVSPDSGLNFPLTVAEISLQMAGTSSDNSRTLSLTVANISSWQWRKRPSDSRLKSPSTSWRNLHLTSAPPSSTYFLFFIFYVAPKTSLWQWHKSSLPDKIIHAATPIQLHEWILVKSWSCNIKSVSLTIIVVKSNHSLPM